MIKLLVTTCLFYSSTVTGYDCDTESWPPEEIALEWQAYCRLSGNSAFAITEDCTYAQYRNATSTHLAEYEAGSVCDSQNPTSGCFIYDSDGSRCHGTLRAVSSGSNAGPSRRTELWAGILSAAIVILLGFYVFTCHGHKIEDVEVFHDDILEIQDDLKPKGKSADVEITELDNRDLPSESGGANLDSIWDEVKEKPKLPTPIRVYIADDEEISAAKQIHTPRTLSPLPRERVPSPQGLKVIIPKVQDSPRNFSEPQFALQKFNTLEASPGDSYRVFVNPASGSSFNLIPAKKHNEYESSRSSFRDHSPYAKRSMSPRCRMISNYISRMKSATHGPSCRPRAESELTLTQAWSLSNAERNRRAHAINGNSVSRSREAHHRKGGGAKPIVTQTRRKSDRRVKSKDISNWNNALQSLMTTRFDTLAVDIEERLQAAQKETSLQLKKMEADFRRQFGEESLPRTKKKSTTPPLSKPLYIVSPSSFEFPPTTPYAISPHAPILSPRSPSYVHPDYVPVTSTPPDRPPSKRGPLTLFDKEHPLTFDSNDYFRPVVPEEPEEPLIKEKRSRILDIKSPSSYQLTSDEPHSDSSIISDSKENLTKSEKRLLEMFFDIFANEMGVLDLTGVQEWVKAVHLTWEDDACREDAMERVMLNGKDGVITRKGYLDYYREMKPARPHKFQKEMTNLKSWNINEEPEREMEENLSLLERDLLERFFEFFARDGVVLEFPDIVQWVKAVYYDWDEDSYMADAEARMMMIAINDQVSKQGYLNFYRDMKQTSIHKFYEELDNLKQWDLPMEPIPRGSAVLVDFDAQGWHRGEVSKRIGDFYTVTIDGASFVVQRDRIQVDPERSSEPRIKPKNMPDSLWKLRDQLGI